MDKSYESYATVGIEKKYRNLENRIMEDVVRRIKKTGEITSSADYQLNRYHILGNSTKDIEDIIKSAVGDSFPETFKLYDEVIEKQYTRSRALYEQVNETYIPYEQNPELQQMTEALIRQSNDELYNITKSMGFKVDMGNGRQVFTPLSDYYNQYLDDAMVEITSGAFDYNTVIRRVVTQMTNSGLRTVDYASGMTSRCDVAARRAVMTGLTQLTGKISDINAAKLHTEYFEIAWHGGARPTHRTWQGKIWSREELMTVCGLGTAAGLEGANCYHERYPFIPGISERQWSDSWLAEQNRKEDIPKIFKGKEYTLYEAAQRQRYLETNMRTQRQKVGLLKSAGADQEEVMLARCKYQAQLDEYKAFSKKMGLPEQRERIYYDMRGRVAPNVFTISTENSIIKDKKMYRKNTGNQIEPMPKKQLQKIVKSFRKNGGSIQMSEATDTYLDSKRAEAITYNEKTILLKRKPGRAAVFEELIHATQYRKGKNDGSYEARLLCEIEAQEKLLQNQKAFGLTSQEVRQTQKALVAYQKELNDLLKGGG